MLRLYIVAAAKNKVLTDLFRPYYAVCFGTLQFLHPVEFNAV